MKTYKKYTISQTYKVVALKLSLPCPFECKNSKGRGTHNFWATTLKLWKNEYFLRVFKSYYYHFFIFLLDSDLEKTLLSQTSIAWGVLDLDDQLPSSGVLLNGKFYLPIVFITGWEVITRTETAVIWQGYIGWLIYI